MVANKPYISATSIQAALDRLIYSNSKKPIDTLLQLSCIDDFLITEDIANIDKVREYALKSILLELITEQYTELRQALQMGEPIPEESQSFFSLDDAHRLWSADVNSGNNRLKAISVLFQKYICSYLELTSDQLADTGFMTSRSVRRLTQEGCQMLSERLMKIESDSLRRHKLNRLRSVLPPLPFTYIEHDAELETVLHWLVHKPRGRFFVVGDHGVGKSSFVSKVCHLLLDKLHPETYPEGIVWIQDAETLINVIGKCRDTLHLKYKEIDLQLYLNHRNVVVILDDIHMLQGELARTLAYLRQASTFVIGSMQDVSSEVHQADVFISLSPFSIDQIEMYLRQVQWTDQVRHKSEISADVLFNHLGGNIGAIRKFLRSPEKALSVEKGGVNRTLLEYLDDNANAGNMQVCVNAVEWILFKELTPNFHIEWRLPSHLQPVDVKKAHVSIQKWLMDTQSRYHLLDHVTEALLTRRHYVDEIAWTVLASESVARLLPPNSASRIKLLRTYWRDAIHLSGVYDWEHLIRYSAGEDDSKQLMIAMFELMSQLGEIDLFEKLSQVLLNYWGQQGDFENQAESIYVIGRHFHRTNQFARSINVLTGLLDNPHCRIKQRVQLELLKIYVELQKPEHATHYATLLSGAGWQADLCICEYEYMMGHDERCQQIAHNLLALPIITYQRQHVAYLKTLIGQSLLRQGVLSEAMDYFEQAMYYFSSVPGSILGSRAVNNFAALLIQADHKDQAKHLIQWASEYQKESADSVGLLYTQHNFRFVLEI